MSDDQDGCDWVNVFFLVPFVCFDHIKCGQQFVFFACAYSVLRNAIFECLYFLR